MKILLTGAVGAFNADMLPSFLREGHRVCLMGDGLADFPVQKHVTVHCIPVDSPEALRIVENEKFDAVVFFFSRRAETPDAYARGALLDALVALEPAAARSGTSTFILITDGRVFGRGQSATELEEPLPDTLQGLLIKAAEDCFTHCISRFPRSLILRADEIYAPNAPDSLFGYAALCAKKRAALILSGSPSSPRSFLRAADLAELILLALREKLIGVLHARGSGLCTLEDVRDALEKALPGLSCQMETGADVPLPLSSATSNLIKWAPRHDWMKELPDMLFPARAPKKRASVREALSKRFGKKLPYLEALLLAGVTFGLTYLLKSLGVTWYPAFWAVYAAFLCGTRGLPLGALGAGLALLFACLVEALSGDLTRVVQTPENTLLPFFLYLLSGLALGRAWFGLRAREKTLERDRDRQFRENDLLGTLYAQAVLDKERLRAQNARPRDSYGRIYDITHALNTLQPEQIFLSALNVLENVLENNAVAIYYYKKESKYARMVLHSADMEGLANSPDMTQFPELLETLNRGEVFANRALLPRYPAFAAPIMIGDEPRAIIVLWQASFDQCTLYYKNLFSVTCGLTESAMRRALEYYRMTQTLYIENTQILSEKPFLDALAVYRRLREKHACSFLLVRVAARETLSAREFNRRIAKAMRSTDIAGRLENGEYLALLPQAAGESLPLIARRFAAQGLSCDTAGREDEAIA